jgi:Protein of unknown function (DUF3662)/FHA domain
MRPLSRLEQLLERLLERPAGRLFKTSLQPIQVQRRIERAMEAERRSAGGRTRVPDRYVVRLEPGDLQALIATSPELAGELADSALGFARSHAYTLADRPRVEFVADPTVSPGDVRVETEPAAAVTSAEAPGDDDRTRAFSIPAATLPAAVLREIRRDGTGRSIPVDGGSLTIGRSSDNDLVLDDTRVSRHHARLRARHGMLVLSDLGSTNGCRVNGVRIDEVVLASGDTIEVGDTVLVVDAVAAD